MISRIVLAARARAFCLALAQQCEHNQRLPMVDAPDADMTMSFQGDLRVIQLRVRDDQGSRAALTLRWTNPRVVDVELLFPNGQTLNTSSSLLRNLCMQRAQLVCFDRLARLSGTLYELGLRQQVLTNLGLETS